MTNPTIDPISYNANTDEYQPRTRERLIEILNAGDQNPRSWQQEAIAFLHRTEPQTAPTCICPRCSATIVGEMNGPEDEPVVTDAERHALAENIEKYCKAIDEAGEKGWRGAVMGDRVELGRLTHENRNLIISSLRAGGRPDRRAADRPRTQTK